MAYGQIPSILKSQIRFYTYLPRPEAFLEKAKENLNMLERQSMVSQMLEAEQVFSCRASAELANTIKYRR